MKCQSTFASRLTKSDQIAFSIAILFLEGDETPENAKSPEVSLGAFNQTWFVVVENGSFFRSRQSDMKKPATRGGWRTSL